MDPADVEAETMDPDVAAPSLDHSTNSAGSDSEIEDEDTGIDEPPRKKQRQNPSVSPKPTSSTPQRTDDKDGTTLSFENGDGDLDQHEGDDPEGEQGRIINYNIHPHFRIEFMLPTLDFHSLMLERAQQKDGAETPSRGHSPDDSTTLAASTSSKSAGKKGKNTKKASQLKIEKATDLTEETKDSTSTAPVSTGADEDGDVNMDSSLSPARSPKVRTAKNGKGRSRTRSISVAAAANNRPKASVPAGLGAADDTDSTLSEPDDAGDDDAQDHGENHGQGEDEDEGDEGAESMVSGATPADQTEDESPSVQGLFNLRIIPFLASSGSKMI